TVVNYGTIRATAASYSNGIFLDAGGSVANFGAILCIGAGGSTGGSGGGGGETLVNGASGAGGALILGYYAGVNLGSAGTVVNFGTIASVATGRAGVFLNGGAGTVSNFGTIAGGPGGGAAIYTRGGASVS